MRFQLASALVISFATFAGTDVATAATIDWTDWTAASGSSVTGSIAVGSTSVGVTYSGVQPGFTQVNGGTNYWSPNKPYLSSLVSNAPDTSDIIALSTAGTSVITFSAPVVNPLIALVSWNGSKVTFGGGDDSQTYNINYLSTDTGYFGTGSFGSPTQNSFTGVGELHGVIELVGTYQSITLNDTTPEYWHGLTVGIVDGDNVTPVPVPAALVLMLSGCAGLLPAVRKRRQA